MEGLFVKLWPIVAIFVWGLILLAWDVWDYVTDKE